MVLGLSITNTLPEKTIWLVTQSATHLSNNYFMFNVMNTNTVEMQNYQKLIKHDSTQHVWSAAFCKELCQLAQGYNYVVEGTTTLFFMDKHEIRNIPNDKRVAYARILVDNRPQKEDPNCLRLTLGGNMMVVPGDLSTKTADLTTSKILWNRVLSTDEARYAYIDIKNMYL